MLGSGGAAGIGNTLGSKPGQFGGGAVVAQLGLAVLVLTELSESGGDMKNWAIIENGVVINAILWDGQSSWEPSEGRV
nr:hypothetical protein [Kluyvera ascorbata]